jgi:hypothetical protein
LQRADLSLKRSSDDGLRERHERVAMRTIARQDARPVTLRRALAPANVADGLACGGRTGLSKHQLVAAIQLSPETSRRSTRMLSHQRQRFRQRMDLVTCREAQRQVVILARPGRMNPPTSSNNVLSTIIVVSRSCRNVRRSSRIQPECGR